VERGISLSSPFPVRSPPYLPLPLSEAILTIPATERTPQVAQGENAEYAIEHLSAAIATWNTGLTSRASTFAAAHADAVVKITDTQPVFNDLLDADPEAASCWNEDGVTCLWFNDYHPGLAIQDAVARAVAGDWEGFFVVS
jgi:hypothetical protein